MTEQRMKNKTAWQNALMHDATGVDNADPVLVDYLLAKIDAPLREALLRRYRDQEHAHNRNQRHAHNRDQEHAHNRNQQASSAKERSQVLSAFRAIRSVIVKDTILPNITPYRRTINSKDIRAINERIRMNAGLSWRDYQELAERMRQ